MAGNDHRTRAIGAPKRSNPGNALYSEPVHRRLVQAAAAGMQRTRMHKLVGVGYHTLQSWFHQGARGVVPYADLCADMERAEAEYELALLQAQRRKALGLPTPNDPRTGEPLAEPDLETGRWMLERRYGYSKTLVVIEVDATPPAINLSGLSDEQFLLLGVQLQGLPDNGAAEHIIIDVPDPEEE